MIFWFVIFLIAVACFKFYNDVTNARIARERKLNAIKARLKEKEREARQVKRDGTALPKPRRRRR